MLMGGRQEVTDIWEFPATVRWTLGRDGASVRVAEHENVLVPYAIALRMRLATPSDVRRAISRVRALLVRSKTPGGTTSQDIEALHILRASAGGMPWVMPGWAHSTARRNELVNKPRSEDWWKKSALRPLQEKMAVYGTIPRGRCGRGWHLFRHTFASHLVQAGVPIYKVARWLGHATVHTTRLYAHLAPGYDSDIEHIGIATEGD